MHRKTDKGCGLSVYFSFVVQCETIVEQHEDEIIEFFAHETDNVKDKLCSKRTGRLRPNASTCKHFFLFWCSPCAQLLIHCVFCAVCPADLCDHALKMTHDELWCPLVVATVSHQLKWRLLGAVVFSVATYHLFVSGQWDKLSKNPCDKK